MLGRKSRCGVKIFVRTLHTSLCMGIPISLLVKKTALKQALVDSDDPVYGIFYLVLLLISLAMYYAACLVGPGYLPLNDKAMQRAMTSNSEEEDMDDEMNALEKGYKQRLCEYCEVEQLMRSKHCEDCKRCVRKYDHHCPWLDVCIGERNHRYFWFFLLFTSVLIAWTLHITWKALVVELTWSDWFHSNLIFLVDLVILIFGGFVIGSLLVFHTYLMVSGLTTWEVVSRERISYMKYLADDLNPFDEGCRLNIFHFLATLNVRRWEVLYSRKTRVKTAGIV